MNCCLSKHCRACKPAITSSYITSLWHALTGCNSATKDNVWCFSTRLTAGNSCLKSSFTRKVCGAACLSPRCPAHLHPQAQSSQSQHGGTSPQTITRSTRPSLPELSHSDWGGVQQSCTVLAWLELNYSFWLCGKGTIGGEITCSSSGQCRHKRTAVRESEPPRRNHTQTGGQHTNTHTHTHTHTHRKTHKGADTQTKKGLGFMITHPTPKHQLSTVYIPTSTSVITACQHNLCEVSQKSVAITCHSHGCSLLRCILDKQENVPVYVTVYWGHYSVLLPN